MNRQTIGILAVLVIAVGIFYWQRSGKKADKPTPTVAGEKSDTPSAPKRMAGADQAKPQQPPPPVSMDDDPVGNLRLEGQVLDRDDKPVKGATVTISSNPERTATSEGDGSFHFDKLVGRTYALRARAGNQVGGPVMHKLTGASDPVVLRLHAGGEVVVTVVTEANAPVSGATVQLRSSDLQTEVSDGDGVARFEGVASGSLAVVAFAPGYGPTRQLVQLPDAENARVTSRVVLNPGAAISGRVIDSKGQPVANAKVLPIDAATLYSLMSRHLDAEVTDKKGEFTIDAVAAGTYRLNVKHDDHAPKSSDPITIDGSTPTTGIEIVLEAGGTIKGRVVTSDQQPVAWASVRVGQDVVNQLGGGVEQRQVTTDEQGKFTMKGLPRKKLAAVAMGEVASSEVTPVDLSGAADAVDLLLVMSIEGTISGTVVDSAGEPIAEAQVTAIPDFIGGAPMKDFALRGMSAQTTDGGGHFAFRGLPPGTYRLRAARSSVSRSSFMQPGTQAATGDTDVTLVLKKNGAIKGRLAYKNGGGAVEIFTVAVAFPPGVPVNNESGEFEVASIPPGKYDVTFRGPEFAEHTVRDVEVRENATHDMGTLDVKRGRYVTGRVLDASGAPVAAATVAVAARLIGDGKSVTANFGSGAEEAMGLRRDLTAEDGSFRVRGIGSKRELLIIAEHQASGRSMPQVVPPGDSNPTYEIALRPFGSLAGTITVGKKPAANLTVIVTPKGARNYNVIVTTGADGNYIIERLPAGEYQVMVLAGGGSGLSSGNSGSAVTTIKAGKRSQADIDISVGDITFKVTIAGVEGAHIDAAQVFIFKGVVAATTGKEIGVAFLEQSAAGAMMSFSMGGVAAVFNQVEADTYSVCVIPINGDLNDPAFQTRINQHGEKLKVYCQPHTIDASPAEQEYTAVVPPMEPLPEEPEEGAEK